ncbi:THUMP domain-containing class I SAM-dependent RNA methyltransferase [Chitinophaga nivalis]|uniref:Class I SAM-dependent RNA methyltransferase n=1 Tax=Chitinophaga nivalis TaxID=2991709 RepID=A0ABT3ILE9_9BACT|nr:class I SAM-dependent RNA methyltransferase [Chitinophaga nivalis]MCW3465505.1 class I SAM-dependent RNA methyltransferase [Chitinophaga nivalis]MCW3484804.1 class I SAM-dependent RNA methyltransferase [Chitinophaga nivalis]
MSFSYTTKGSVTITCNKRLTPFLEQEVRDLGFTITETFVTGVRLQATLNECIRLNLNLRCGSQVLYSLKQFEAADGDEIYSQLCNYPWETILPDDGYFSITSNVQNETINNSMFANLRVKDAIVDRLRQQTGRRPSTGAELTGAVINLFWKNTTAEIFVDTSGDSLARHGYRKIPGRAPMLEALAASTILATQWNRTAPFVNPMCGSGTVAIEAALIATNSRPGLFRDNYAFMHLQGYDENVYLEERGILENQIREVPGLHILATDLSEAAIVNARKNAKAAGVADLIEFKVCDFADTPIPENGAGVVYMNPEYGLRLGEIEALEETYGRMGDFLKQKCGGYYGYIFTGNLDLAKKIGLKAKRRIEFFNSTIDCRLLEYELYAGTKRTN